MRGAVAVAVAVHDNALWRAAESVCAAFQNLCKTEVNQLEVAIVVNQYILRLQVTCGAVGLHLTSRWIFRQ